MANYYFRCGKTKEAVAEKIGIAVEKLSRIMGGKNAVDNAECLEALTRCEVELALLKKARGYTYTEVKETEKDKGSEVTTLRKEAAPDVSAAKLWLDGCSPEGWGHRADGHTEEKLDGVFDMLDEVMKSKDDVQ